VLITGAARRIGAAVARTLHADGANVVLHYRSSRGEAETLRDELESRRGDSVALLQADLSAVEQIPPLVEEAAAVWGRLDVLINNASTFYPTPIGEITEAHWKDLFGTNLKAPLFLSQAAAPHLTRAEGVIINIVDIHAMRPLKGYPVYCAAKAGLWMLTQSLARELGPQVRVNGVAPGAILWPEDEANTSAHEEIIERTALKREGSPQDIATTILFLIRDAHYVTGQVLPVDGGRTLAH
jgi:pteridine reductase